jgi:hypothetical protein
MQLYPYGTVPVEKPEWITKLLTESNMNATAIPFWLLNKNEDMSAPAAFFLQMPPGYVLSRHGHPCERFEVVIKGSLDVGDGRTAYPGDIFTAEAGTLYGPHTAGPEGCTTIEIFSKVDAMFRMLYAGPNGEILEADARKGETAPDYIPLPGEADYVLAQG